jgi:hypothetical protein
LGIGQAVLVLDQKGLQLVDQGIGMQATLIAADPTGESLARGSSSIYQRFSDTDSEPDPDRSNPVSVGKQGQEFASLFGRPLRVLLFIMQGRSMDSPPMMTSRIEGVSDPVHFFRKPFQADPVPHLSPELKRNLLQPDVFDPLSFVVGPALTASAEALHLNLVADLPDTSFATFCQLFQSAAATAGASDLLGPECSKAGMVVKKDGSWVVLNPVKPVEASSMRVNRIGLGKLLRSMDKKGLVDLDDVASYLMSQEKDVRDVDIDGMYLQIVESPLGKKVVTMSQNPNALKIYGARTPSQREALASSGSVSLNSLTADQKRWLVDDVFNSVDGPAAKAMRPTGPRMPFQDPRGNLKTERTQVLANGIRPDGRLTFSLSVLKGYTAVDPDTGTSAFLTLPDLAGRLYQNEKPQMGTPVAFKTYLRSSMSTISLQFEVSEGYFMTRNLESIEPDRNSQAVAFDGIGDDDKKELQDILSKIRSTLGRMRITSGGFQTAPPP